MYNKIASLRRRYKNIFYIALDFVLLPFCFWASLSLRLGDLNPFLTDKFLVIFLLPIFSIPVFFGVGLYRIVVRYIDEKFVFTAFLASSASTGILIGIAYLRSLSLPRSSAIIYWVICLFFIVLSRYFIRYVVRTLEVKGDEKRRVAIYGAGRAGLQTALALISANEFKPVAFFDDNPDLKGTNLVGLKVYDPNDAIEVMRKYDCRDLLIAMPSIQRSQRLKIIQKYEGLDINLKTLPGIGELVHGTVRIEDIREVGVEDLLGRDSVPPFTDLMTKSLSNLSVLITGAGGSIGSELCRQIIQYAPDRIVLFENNEFAVYRIEKELRRFNVNVPIFPILGDILNREHVRKVIQDYSIDTIYHAAAYKHVPLVESNTGAAFRNNVLGTLNMTELAADLKVRYFVLVSTDKAVRPTNMMGATKRLAELVVQAVADRTPETKMTIVRFGNVLGSSGSVVPLFKDQIRSGGPVTVTHPEVTRYFMTIPEAAQLVIQASSLGNSGQVFVLDMGDPVRIVDLARKMIELSGFVCRDPHTGQGDIGIEFVGLRPGEKLYEELLIGENVQKTVHPRIQSAEEVKIPYEKLMDSLNHISASWLKLNDSQIKALVKKIVPEYQPKDLVDEQSAKP
jgi:FlaA1/EpsC-like NDP-sugar epimerase